MALALISGSCGLIGSETTNFLCELGFDVVGIDNDMRRVFFGEEASTDWNRRALLDRFPKRYHHLSLDIRDKAGLESLFRKYGTATELVVHTAAQPSHDWAVKEPITDFAINATGTLNLLENTRRYSPGAVFIFCSTNKVYGDTPNLLPFTELETRWEVVNDHKYFSGIDETMNIDQSKHSLFGASKVAADILVQEYGRYFGMKTVCFRGGCLTGPNQSATMLHGFLAYLMKCTVTGDRYTIYGYKGKQVRDNIHSYDLVNAFYHFFNNPREGEVYNIGGGRHCNCSVLEAIELCEEITGKKLVWTYDEKNRIGDHIWYISSLDKFRSHYPQWELKFDLTKILKEIYNRNLSRWKK